MYCEHGKDSFPRAFVSLGRRPTPLLKGKPDPRWARADGCVGSQALLFACLSGKTTV